MSEAMTEFEAARARRGNPRDRDDPALDARRGNPRDRDDPALDARLKAYASETRKLPCVEVKHRALLALDVLEVDYAWGGALLTEARRLILQAAREAAKAR